MCKFYRITWAEIGKFYACRAKRTSVLTLVCTELLYNIQNVVTIGLASCKYRYFSHTTMVLARVSYTYCFMYVKSNWMTDFTGIFTHTVTSYNLQINFQICELVSPPMIL